MKSTSKTTTWKTKLLPFAALLALAGVRTAGAVDYPSTILADHPSAYYRFEELSGATQGIIQQAGQRKDLARRIDCIRKTSEIWRAESFHLRPMLGLSKDDYNNSCLFHLSDTGLCLTCFSC